MTTHCLFFFQNFVPHVSLDVNVADFGNCQNLRVIEDKILNLTNHTKGKITVQWVVGMLSGRGCLFILI